MDPLKDLGIEPQSQPHPAPQPARQQRQWLAIMVVAMVILGAGGIAAARFLAPKPASPKTSASPGIQPSVSNSETTKIGSGPVASTTELTVTALSAQSADLTTALAKALQVSADATIQGNLTVNGNGTFGGNIQAANFVGSGANLTGVDAALLNGKPGSFYSNLASNLSNAALLNAANTFTSANTFAGGLTSATITDNGALTVGGAANLNGTTTIANLILGAPLTVPNGGTGLTTVPAASILYGQGGPVLGVATPAGAGLCLLSGATDVQWGSCSGGGAGVAMIDGLSGVLTLANSSGVGTTITIDNAGTAAKGIASFNATNFSVVNGAVDTIQSIATTATPSFAGLALSAPLTVANGGTGAASLAANGAIIGNGTGALTSVVAGAPNLCLESTAGAPTWAACTGGAAGGVTSLDALSGVLTVNNSTGSGSAITINDAAANGATKGIATFNGTNFSASSGVINTIQDISSSASPAFAAVDTNSISPSAALTIGNAAQQFTIQGNASSIITANGGGSTTTIGFSGSPTGAVTYDFDRSAAAGSYTICTTIGNCAGSGGGITGGGAAGKIAKFTGSGTTIGNSSIADTGSSVSVTPGSNNVSVFQIQNASGRSLLNIDTSGNKTTLGNITSTVGQGVTGTLVLADGTNDNFGVSFAPATLSNNRAITVPNAAGTLAVSASGPIQLDAAGNITCPSCVTSGGGGGGVAAVDSVDNLTGALTINNSTGSGTAITINNALADGATKGIAAFNGTNFSASSGVINTIQDITSGSTPTFAGVDTNNITPSGLLTVGDTGKQFTIQGSASSTITATGGGFATTIGFSGSPVGAVTYNFDRAAAAGAYTVCTTANNCLGGPSGGANTLLSNLAATTAINSSLVPGSSNSIDVGSASTLFRNGYFATGLQAPLLQTAAGTTSAGLVVQTGNASAGVSGNITVDNGTFTSGTPSILIGNSNQAHTISLGTGTGTQAVSLGSTSGSSTTAIQGGAGGTLVNATAGNLTLSTTTSGTLAVTSAGALNLTGVVAINNGFNGDTSINTGSSTGNVHIVDGTGTGTIGIGNSAAGAITLQSASAINMTEGASSTFGAASLATGSGTGFGYTIQAGNETGVSGTGGGLTFNAGNATGASGNRLGGNVTIDAGTGTNSLGQPDDGSILIGSNSASAITIGKNGETSTLNLRAGGGTTNISEDGGAKNTINISNSAFSQNNLTNTINIGNVASTANTGDTVNVAIGTAAGVTGGTVAGTTIIQAQGLSQTITGSATSPTDVVQTLNNSTGAFQVQNASSVNVLNVDTSANILTVATSANGGELINNGSSLNTAKSLGNFGSNGALGTAASTVDIYTTFVIPQATPSITLTVPSPTDATAGRIIYIANTGSVSITIAGITLTAGSNMSLLWNGSAWTSTAVSTGVTLVGAFSGSSQANGASISGNTITFGPADTTNPGMVTASGTQTFGGDKIFKDTSSSTAFQVQNATGDQALAVNTATPNAALGLTNPSFENGTAGWTARSGCTLTQSSTMAVFGSSSAKCVTNTSPSAGIQTNVTLTPGVQYTFSFYASLNSDPDDASLTFGYAFNGSNESTYTQTEFLSTGWDRFSLTFTPSSVSGTPYFYIEQGDGTARSNGLFIDGVQVEASSGASDFNDGSVTLGVVTSPLMLEPTSNSGNALWISQPANSQSPLFSVNTKAFTVGIGVGDGGVAQNLLEVGQPNNDDFTATSMLTSESGTDKALVVQGASSQSVSVFEAQDSSGAPLFSIGATGSSAIKTTSNSATALQILDSGSATALAVSTNNIAGGANAANATLTLGKDSGTGRSINAAGTINASGADYAEYFTQAVAGKLGLGELTCLTPTGTAEACIAATAGEQLIGAVSTNPGYVGNDIYDSHHPDRTALVGLLGQIPVKVSAQNGAIQPGDMLTMSDQPGVAIKATGTGTVLGSALESYSGSGTGLINVYVHVGYYAPPLDGTLQPGSPVQNGGNASFASLNVSGLATLASLTVTGNATITGQLTVGSLTVNQQLLVNGHIVSGGAAPTIAAAPAACTAPTVAIAGTDTAGLITVTAGKTGCTTAGALATVTFGQAFTAPPRITLTPASATAAALQYYVDDAAVTTTAFDLNSATKPTPGTTYKWYYHSIQ